MTPLVIYVKADAFDLWSFLGAIGTLVLAVTAILAYRAALGQTAEWRRIARIERTAELIREASSQDIQDLVDFFDYDPDHRYNRIAVTELYRTLDRARESIEGEMEQDDPVWRPEANIVSALRRWMSENLDDDIADEKTMRPYLTDVERFDRLRGWVLDLANFYERVYVLLENEVVDRDIFFQANQDYNIVVCYFILEDVLRILDDDEGYDWDDFRKVALLAQRHFRTRPEYNPVLADAVFASLS